MRARLPVAVEAIEPRRLLSADPATYDELLESQPSESVMAEWKQPSIASLRGYHMIPLRDGAMSQTMELAWFEGNLPIDQYAATINWGDGTTSAGTLARMGDRGYWVLGTHDYAAPGEYRARVEIVATDGHRQAHGLTVMPYAQPLQLMHQHEFEEPQENGTRMLYSVFFYPSFVSNTDLITATIDWGDGTVMQFRVNEIWSGAMAGMMWHDYAAPGTYQVTFTATGPTYDGEVATLVISKSVELLGYYPPEEPGEWAVLHGGERISAAPDADDALGQAPPPITTTSDSRALFTTRAATASIARTIFADESPITGVD